MSRKTKKKREKRRISKAPARPRSAVRTGSAVPSASALPGTARARDAKRGRSYGGEIEFPKKGNIMRLLGEVYEDIRDALGEFVSNAEDADATKIRIHLVGRGRIVVEDNGAGMTGEEMASVPRRVGDSIRALQEGKIGEKGIGILGFQAFADRCTIISRGKGKGRTWRLSLVAGNPNFRIASVRDGFPRSGTEAVISGIRGRRSRVFAKKPLVAWLQSKYRQALQERRFQLEVVDEHERLNIRPTAYQGEHFKLAPVRTRHGAVRANLFISPHANNFRVGVTHRGRMVVHDITEMPGLHHEPWTSGKVQGEVSCDFCRQTTGRGGFVHDDGRWDVWVRAVRGLEGPLKREIRARQEEEQDRTDQEIFGRLNTAMSRALREFDEIESLLARVQRTAIGPGPRTGRSKKKPVPAGRSPAGKLIERLPPRGFTFEIEDFEDTSVHLHSQYDRPLNMIRINRLHPDYERESQNPENRERYIVKLTTKELVLTLYPGISRGDQLEKLVQLELCVNRNL